MVVYTIYACSVLALLTSAFFAIKVKRVSIAEGTESEQKKFKEISSAIAEGAMAFLAKEYKYVAIFAVFFALVMTFLLNDSKTPELNEGLYSAVSFLIGAVTSSICAFLGMKIATIGNVRTTIQARHSISHAFKVAFQSGAVMGFGLVGLALFAMITITLYYLNVIHDPLLAMEMVAGFGLGGSTVALFGRVGGGIYTKAADVGADLVGKVEKGIPEDDPRNPAVIADNVGDNVGDIAGMGADLFGSCAEATCAALVIGASASQLANNVEALLYPILITAIGIPVCLITAFFARLPKDAKSSEPVLKMQLVISTVLMSAAIWFVTNWVMVPTFEVNPNFS